MDEAKFSGDEKRVYLCGSEPCWARWSQGKRPGPVHGVALSQPGIHSVGQRVGDLLDHSRDTVLVTGPFVSCDEGHVEKLSPCSFLCWTDLES